MDVMEKNQIIIDTVADIISRTEEHNSLENQCLARGFRKIILYGYGVLGATIFRELRDSRDVNIVAIMDSFPNLVKGVPAGVPILGKEDKAPEYDAIIVTAVAAFDKIKEDLGKRGYENIVNPENFEIFKKKTVDVNNLIEKYIGKTRNQFVEELIQSKNQKIINIANENVIDGIEVDRTALYVVTANNGYYEIGAKLYDKGVALENIFLKNSPRYTYQYRSLLPESNRAEVVAAMHNQWCGVYPNIKRPKTYNEIIMHDVLIPDPMRSRLADKYEVREWIKQEIGEEYLVPLIGVWDNVEDIPFDKLPKKYALKANHGCGWNIINHGNGIDIELTKVKLYDWLHSNFACACYEMHYGDINPQIICEEYIQNVDDLYDYKVFSFDGKPEYIMFLSDRKNKLKMSFYDLEWNKLDFVYSFQKNLNKIEKPKYLDKIIKMSKKMSKIFNQVRIDWYVLNNGDIKFGEMTFSSCAGHAKWTPIEYDAVLGKKINKH